MRKENNNDLLSTIIPYHNKAALAGYYVAVFSYIPILGFILAPLAIGLGVFGYKGYIDNREAKGQYHAYFTIFFGALMTILHYGCFIYLVIQIYLT